MDIGTSLHSHTMSGKSYKFNGVMEPLAPGIRHEAWLFERAFLTNFFLNSSIIWEAAFDD